MSKPSITPEAAELGRRMFDSLRSTDMRYEGAHILAEYIVQAGQMFQAAAEVEKSNSQLVRALEEQRQQIEELAALTPSMLTRAEARLAESTDRQVAAIAAAGQAQRQVLETLLADLRRESEQLQASRWAADQQQHEIRLAREKLERERSEFNNISWWRRLSARA